MFRCLPVNEHTLKEEVGSQSGILATLRLYPRLIAIPSSLWSEGVGEDPLAPPF
jgi:hypothetical protein